MFSISTMYICTQFKPHCTDEHLHVNCMFICTFVLLKCLRGSRPKTCTIGSSKHSTYLRLSHEVFVSLYIYYPTCCLSNEGFERSQVSVHVLLHHCSSYIVVLVKLDLRCKQTTSVFVLVDWVCQRTMCQLTELCLACSAKTLLVQKKVLLSGHPPNKAMRS